ncbi:hypothetical protein [Hymenobacter pini]|uniref:hypothetical protein n=1 Tax=Hymenobacter pini TaxID=2880879 RepID=UPI001CF540E9|nr:hypothetical protein [Hymenobacter pini]MCA8830677.1 hypothetical protein [Hymenobacter pini]
MSIKPEPREIFCTPQLRLLTTEEDWETQGKEFRDWLDLWGELEHEFGRYPGLFRLHTEPEIPGLHQQLVSDLCRLDAAGVFLQLLEPRPNQQLAGTSWLVYLEFATRQWQRVAETGGFYLLPDAVGESYQFSGIQAGGSRLEVQAYPTQPVS